MKRSIITKRGLEENKMVHVTFIRSFQPTNVKHYIASIKKIEDQFGYIILGHGYDIDTKKMTCGEFGLEWKKDFIVFETITNDEFEEWKKHYESFHNKIVKISNYDFCEENVNNLFI